MCQRGRFDPLRAVSSFVNCSLDRFLSSKARSAVRAAAWYVSGAVVGQSPATAAWSAAKLTRRRITAHAKEQSRSVFAWDRSRFRPRISLGFAQIDADFANILSCVSSHTLRRFSETDLRNESSRNESFGRSSEPSNWQECCVGCCCNVFYFPQWSSRGCWI